VNIVKTIFVFFACALLVGSQIVFAHGPQPASKPQVCGCCSCKILDCCVALPLPAPPTVPAPARALSHNNVQLISTVVALLVDAPSPAATTIAFPASASFKLIKVPLYQRNCTYLI
jgi:hypothetical protein